MVYTKFNKTSVVGPGTCKQPETLVCLKNKHTRFISEKKLFHCHYVSIAKTTEFDDKHNDLDLNKCVEPLDNRNRDTIISNKSFRMQPNNTKFGICRVIYRYIVL